MRAPSEFGHGAWQVGVRYNYLNLDDKGIDGGFLNDLTLGLNWYINPNMKFQWNFSATERHSRGAWQRPHPGLRDAFRDGLLAGGDSVRS
jgi:phosphate-selective porin